MILHSYLPIVWTYLIYVFCYIVPFLVFLLSASLWLIGLFYSIFLLHWWFISCTSHLFSFISYIDNFNKHTDCISFDHQVNYLFPVPEWGENLDVIFFFKSLHIFGISHILSSNLLKYFFFKTNIYWHLINFAGVFAYPCFLYPVSVFFSEVWFWKIFVRKSLYMVNWNLKCLRMSLFWKIIKPVEF